MVIGAVEYEKSGVWNQISHLLAPIGDGGIKISPEDISRSVNSGEIGSEVVFNDLLENLFVFTESDSIVTTGKEVTKFTLEK